MKKKIEKGNVSRKEGTVKAREDKAAPAREKEVKNCNHTN